MPKPTLLLVEIELLSGRGEGEELEALGYRLVAVGGVEAALRELDREGGRVDLVLLDLGLLEGGTGVEALVARAAGLPLLFRYRPGQEGLLELAEPFGPYGFVAETAGPAALAASARAALGLRALRGAGAEVRDARSDRERAIVEADTLSKSLIACAAEGIIVYDQELRYLVWNPFMERLTGLSAAEVLGRRPLELFPFLGPTRLMRRLEGALLGEAPDSEELAFASRGRSGRVIDTSAPLRDAAGRIIGVIATVQDVTRLRRADLLLEEGERRARAMLEAMPDLIFRIGEDGRYLDFKADVKDLYHQAPEGILGKHYRETLPQAFSDFLEARIAEALRSRELQTFTYELDIPAAGPQAYEARMIASGPGEVTAVVRNISGEREKQRLLDESEERFRLAFDRAPIGITLTALDGSLSYVNQAYCEMLGYSAEELRSLKFNDITHPEDRDLSREQVELLAEGKREQSVFRKRYVRKDGGLLWVELRMSLARDPDGRPRNFITHVRDISEELRLEEAREELGRLYSDIFHRSRAVMLLIDPASLAIVDANKAAEDFYGLGGEELKRLRISDLNVLPAAEVSRITTAIAEGEVGLRRLRHRTAGGKLRDVEVFPSPLDFRGRRLNHAIIFDQTERIEAEERNARLLGENELLLREVQHRVKNSMNLVASFVELRRQASTSPEASSVLSEVGSQLRGMSMLYERLYRLRQGGTSLPLESFLPELLRESLGLLARDTRIDLEVQLVDLELPAGILSSLGIVLVELLTNSVKYAGFERRPSPAIALRARMEEGRLELYYEDNGVGLPPDFDLAASKGFGMMVARGLMEQLGGSIEPRKGEGAAFRLELPL